MVEPVRQSEEDIQQWILRRLGAPQLEVELTREDLEDAVNDAKLWFSVRLGVTRYYFLDVAQGDSRYTIPADVDTVLNIDWPLRATDLSFIVPGAWLLPGQAVPASLFYGANDGGRFSNLVQTMQYLDMARRVTSAEPDWRQEGRTLYIFAAPSASRLRVQFKANLVVLSELDNRAYDLVRRMTLARSKEKLGRVRSKYDSAQTAAGSTGLDGATLLQEASDAIEALNEEIMQAGLPLPILIG